MSFADIIGLVGGVGGLGALGGLFRIRSTNRKLTAEARNLDAKTTTLLVGTLDDRLVKALAEADELRSKMSTMQDAMDHMTLQLKQANVSLADMQADVETYRRRSEYYEAESMRLTQEMIANNRGGSPRRPDSHTEGAP